MPSSTFSADAVISPHSFTADAWILGERARHHRVRDHFGSDSDLYIVLDTNIGPYVAFTPVHYVLEDMVSRIEALENNDRVRASFTADAFLATSGTWGQGFVTADAVIEKLGLSDTFTADAAIALGGTFTADAWIAGSFTADAWIV